MKKILSIFLCLAIVIGFVPFGTHAANEISDTAVTELTTGTYVMVAVNASGEEKSIAGIYDNGWVTSLTSKDDAAAIWTITVVSSGVVTLKDSNGAYIAPKSGNSNGIQTVTTAYEWAVSFADGCFQFKGQGSDTTTLAANVSGTNGGKIRAYKNGTVSSSPNSYLTNFKLYAVTPCTHAVGTSVVASFAQCYNSCKDCGAQIGEATAHTLADNKFSCTTCGLSADLSTVAGIEAATEILAVGESLPNLSLTGTVIRVDSAYSAQYGNISVTVRFTDDSGSAEILCFRLQNGEDDGEDNDFSGLKVNDTLTVTGVITNYQGTIEFNAGCTATNIVAGMACEHTDLQWHDEDGMHWQTCKADGCVYTTAKAAHATTDTEWSKDADGHYHLCSCGVKMDVTPHTPEVDDHDCKTALLCTECAYEIAAAMTEHTLAWNDTAEAGKHFQECTVEGCDYKTEACAGALEQVKDDETNHHDKCTVLGCEYVGAAQPHSYPSTGTAADYSSSKDGHYQICACGHITTLAAHDGPDADGECTVCGYKMTCDHDVTKKDWDETNHWDVCQAEDCKQELNTEKHTLQGDYNDTHHWTYCTAEGCEYKTTEEKHTLVHKSDATHHWSECACGYATTKEAHSFTTNSDETNHWSECACGDTKDSAAHEFAPKYDETSHWQECACGDKKDVVAHTLVNKYDETQHWTECACGYTTTKEAHTEPKTECACGYKTAPTQVVIGYDFSKLEANGNEIGADETDPIEALTLFKKAATNSKYLKKVSTTKIYRGSTNGGGLEGKDGYLKLGTSKVQGQIVLTYAEGVKVTKVEIYCHDWYTKTEQYPTNSNTVSVNGSEGQLAPYNETGAVGMLTFELAEASNVLTIDSNKRVFISKIVVYTEVSEEVNDGTGDMFGVVLTALVVSGMGITVLKKKEF